MEIKKELFHYFNKAGRTVQYHCQDIIYMQEDQADELFLIIKGRVRVYVMNSNGEEVTLEILKCGHIFGESSFLQDAYRPTTVEAVEETTLIACRLQDLLPIIKNSQKTLLVLFQMMSQTCNYLTAMIKRAYTYDRYEKMAAFLLDQRAFQKNNVITYTHEEIASLLGLSRVTVTKVLNEFEKRKWIEKRYKKIIVRLPEEISSFLHKR